MILWGDFSFTDHLIKLSSRKNSHFLTRKILLFNLKDFYVNAIKISQ